MIPGSGRSAGKGIGYPYAVFLEFQELPYPTPVFLGFPGGSAGKESTCNSRDLGSIPGLERSPGEGNGNPLQYSCLDKSMDRRIWWAIVHGVAKS